MLYPALKKHQGGEGPALVYAVWDIGYLAR